jgi:hypothetical protein
MMTLLIFVLAALLGALLLSAAIVAWLGEVAMSLPVALLVVGLVWSVVAIVIYSCSLRASLERLRSRLDVVYKVSAAFDMVYRRVMAIIDKFLEGI